MPFSFMQGRVYFTTITWKFIIKSIIMDAINEKEQNRRMKKRKVYLEDIINKHPDLEYLQIYAYIMQLIEREELVPMKSAKSNGRKPALPLSFWKCEKEPDYTEIYEELKYKYHPLINISYYREHPEYYEADKENLQLLSDYLKDHSELLSTSETMNERSFEIFHREKFFQKEGGLEFCKKIAIEPEKLAFYRTSEPLSYYSYSKKAQQNILIIENKDTFFDIRRYMNAGCNVILGKEFDTVIYGAGKGIWKTFVDYVNGAERYFLENNELFYFGDLDYEGILIYEHLLELYPDREIHIFKEAYEEMLDKALKIGFSRLPNMKEKQNANIGTVFLDGFDGRRREQIHEILGAGKYIPQEILNEHDW